VKIKTEKATALALEFLKDYKEVKERIFCTCTSISISKESFWSKLYQSIKPDKKSIKALS